MSQDDKILAFYDNPAGHLPGVSASSYPPQDSVLAFMTTLVGVDENGNPVDPPLYHWSWNTTFNGTFGGIHDLPNPDLRVADAGSGIGGITITNINGIQLPPNVSSQVRITQNGFARNHATGLWVATLSVKNIGASTVSGPIQVVLNSLSFNATMVNNNGMMPSLGPFITVSTGSLAPGASISVPIQFTNPSNGFITFTPITYSGTF